MHIRLSTLRSPGRGFWLFLVLVGVYLFSYSGVFHSIDEVSVTAMTETLVKHGRVSTDQIRWSQDWTPSQGRIGPDGHLYSKKGLGSALLGSSFYWLAMHLPPMGAVRSIMLANALVTALTGWLVYRCVLLLDYRPVVAVLTALGYGLGTMAWPYAKYFFSEPLTTLGLMLALWGLLSVRQTGRARYVVISGGGLGAAVLAKVANMVVLPLFLVYGLWLAFHQKERMKKEWGKRLLVQGMALLVPLAIAGTVLLVYNTARTGHPLDMGYAANETFSTPLGLGLFGLLISPGKGLFLYSPLLLAALFGIPALLRRDRATALLNLGVVVAYPLLYAGWFMWWGGWSWGPRFLVPLLPFLSLFLAPVFDRVLNTSGFWARIPLALLGLLSLLIQILGVTVDFNSYLLQLYQRGIDSAEVNFRVDLSPLLGHLSLLRAGDWDLAWARDLKVGIDWPLLLWPLALLAVALVGWSIMRQKSQIAARFLAPAGVMLLVVSAIVLAQRPPSSDDWSAGCQKLSATLQQTAGADDVMLVDLLPYSDHYGRTVTLLDCYKADPAYWGWAREEPVSEERRVLLASLNQDYQGLWLLLDTTPEGDPASTTEQWLDEHAFRVESQWLSPAMRLVSYRLSSVKLDDTPQIHLDLRLGDQFMLEGYSVVGPLEAQAGEVVTFSLFWQAEQSVEQSYTVFVQLLDQEGRLKAQVDRPPVAGFRPTDSWHPGELIRDNYGLELPPDLAPGLYRLIAGLYLPPSQERLEASTLDGMPLGDYVLLTEIVVLDQVHP